jgi:hypothetical protein
MLSIFDSKPTLNNGILFNDPLILNIHRMAININNFFIINSLFKWHYSESTQRRLTIYLLFTIYVLIN